MNKQSAKTPFFQRTWLKTIGGLLLGVGILGGGQLYDRFKSGPDIKIKLEYLTPSYGYSPINKRYEYVYTLELSLVNKGDKPYFPRQYRLIAEFGGQRITFHPYSLKDYQKAINTGIQEVHVDPKSDLTRIKEVPSNGIASGFLEFMAPIQDTANLIDLQRYDFLQVEILDQDEDVERSEKYSYKQFGIRNENHPRNGVELKRK
jgi:hypothetical protein